MALFDIDYDFLTIQLMPVRLRQALHMSWLKVLVSPVKGLYGLFITNRDANLYKLGHSGQVCFLEAVINDVFDNTHRRIFISDGPVKRPCFFYICK